MMAVVDTTPGFKFMYRLGGEEEPTIQKLYFKDTETLTKGDLVNVESGTADLAATNDAAFLGAAMETKAGTSAVDQIEVIVDDDAVYAVYDANARSIGDTLDLSGTTGAQTVTTTSNADFIVVANSTADQLTLVRIKPANHATHL